MGGKAARANAICARIEAGNVYLPHPQLPSYEWVNELLDELMAFPHGRHDDQVDAMTQALARLNAQPLNNYEADEEDDDDYFHEIAY